MNPVGDLPARGFLGGDDACGAAKDWLRFASDGGLIAQWVCSLHIVVAYARLGSFSTDDRKAAKGFVSAQRRGVMTLALFWWPLRCPPLQRS
jgi:hypothetical protein